MKFPPTYRSLLILSLAAFGFAANTTSYADPLSASHGGTLLQYDFNNANSWPQMKVVPPPAFEQASLANANVGTIDVPGSVDPSGGLLFTAQNPKNTQAGDNGFVSGSLAINNKVANTKLLTLSFSLSSSEVKPVRVWVISLNARHQRTGGLNTVVYPAAANFYQRYAIDLCDMTSVGSGRFRATDPFVEFGFSAMPAATSPSAVAPYQLRLDNVNYATAAYFVSPQGSDNNDGRTELTAFATPQKAVDVAQPGDIVDVMDGTYLPNGVQEGIAAFHRAGSPADWIVLKNYPGQHPLFSLIGSWGAIRIRRTPQDPPIPTICYLEIRGLHIRGEGDVAIKKYASLLGQSEPFTNGNGIGVAWVPAPGQCVPHDLRFADNTVEYCTGGGIGPGDADWVYIENNIVRNNCWTTIYATSGISLNHGTNFNGDAGEYTILIRNNTVSGNRCYVPWRQIGKLSDGNGIIVDFNQDPSLPENLRRKSRTLIENNVSFNNGGSGIHAIHSKGVDIINNTVYMNAQTPELRWGQLFIQSCQDVNITNNIVVAPVDLPIDTVGFSTHDDQGCKDVTRGHNLYFGGKLAPVMGDGDVVADPQFVNASTDYTIANFHLRPASPAIGAGIATPFSPLLDLDGNPRSLPPTEGAFEK